MKAIPMPRFQITAVRLAIFFIALRLTAGALLRNHHDTLHRYEGNEVELQCQTTLSYPVSWQFTPTHSKTDRPIEIFSGGEISPLYASEFKINQNRTAGLYILVIPQAKTSHSGEYICLDDDAMSTEQLAIILTVGSRPCDTGAKYNTQPLISQNGAYASGVLVRLLFVSAILVFNRIY